MTHPHEGLQEPALREALHGIQRLKRSIMIDVGSCHSLRGPGASSEMRDDDRDLRRDIEEAFAKIDAALSLPQQAATDEGEVRERLKLAELVRTRLLGIHHDDQDLYLEDHDWQRIIAALSTPTAQPPAAETRLREAIQQAWENDVCDAMCDAENGKVVGNFTKLWEKSRVRAALTQPEPTAQQATGEPDKLRHKLWMVMSHASGGHLSNEADVDRSINDICVTISQHHNRVWQAALEKGREEALSAQQAAGEAEAVGTVKQSLTVEDLDKETTLTIVRWQGRIHCAYLNDFRIVGGKPWAGGSTEKEWKVTLREVVRAFPELQKALGMDYLGRPIATPQPTETQRIVAWLRAQSDIGADRGIASEEGTTRRAAYGGGSLALKRAADAIEAGEHLAGEGQ